MSSGCNYDGCTVAETGACALARDPSTCANRTLPDAVTHGTAEIQITAAAEAVIGSPVLDHPKEAGNFTPSHTLGLDLVSEMMASRPITVVGILGEPDSGKTACLASIYLLVANAALKGWKFLDSRSLMGFEDIARGARVWNEGSPPSQMTMHTEMAEDRRAGFLHLRLKSTSDGQCLDLALPDLPGEWTTKLVANSQSDRFDFLKSAEIIWIVIDGRAVMNKERRQGAIARLGQLGGRLMGMFDSRVPRVLVVVTHRDEVELSEVISVQLVGALQKKGVKAEVLQVASFSENDAVPAGFGLEELIDISSKGANAQPQFWPDRAPAEEARSYIAYRRGH